VGCLSRRLIFLELDTAGGPQVNDVVEQVIDRFGWIPDLVDHAGSALRAPARRAPYRSPGTSVDCFASRPGMSRTPADAPANKRRTS